MGSVSNAQRVGEQYAATHTPMFVRDKIRPTDVAIYLGNHGGDNAQRIIALYEQLRMDAENAALITSERYTDMDVADDWNNYEGTLSLGAISWMLSEDANRAGDFVRDMRVQFDSRGLSIAQMRGVLNSFRSWAQRAYRPFDEAEVEQIQALRPFIAMLDTAREKKVRWPKIRLVTHDMTPVVISLSGSGRIYVSNGGKHEENIYYGEIKRDGTHTIKNEEIINFLVEVSKNPVEGMKATGIRMGFCGFCGRTLLKEGSVDVGYGPICAQKYGLPHPSNGG